MMVFQALQIGKKEDTALNNATFKNKTINFTKLKDGTLRVTVIMNEEEARMIDSLGTKGRFGPKVWGMKIEETGEAQLGAKAWGMKALTFEIKPDTGAKLDTIVPKKK